MVAQLAPERDMRGPGCDARCQVIRVIQPGVFGRQEILAHSPDAHEHYGRSQAAPTEFDVIRTGKLAINRDQLTAEIDGRVLDLTANESGLLLALSERLDHMVSYRTLVHSVWDLELLGAAELHMIRSVVFRFRAAVGPEAAGLIQTVKGRGLRLLALPVGEAAPPVVGGHLNGRWSLKFDACVECKTTDRAHYARGVCWSPRCKARLAARRARTGGAP